MVSKKLSMLVIDDDASILCLLKRTLDLEGYRTFTANEGKSGLDLVDREMPDLIILDITMPGMDGYTICQHIREFSQVPIIMVTARGNEEEKVRGFECGADDYVTKPFFNRELVARVKSVLKRSQIGDAMVRQPTFKIGNFEMDFVKRMVIIAGNKVGLTPTEYQLLQELVLNRGKVLTHIQLLQKVWGPEYLSETEYLHVFIGRLRSKLHLGLGDQRYIITVPGVGYQFKDTA
jgi:DNA-binding response OmpR family regulator